MTKRSTMPRGTDRRVPALVAGIVAAAFALTAHAAPVPGFTPAPSGGGDILSDGAYAVRACIDNLSPTDTGYSPTLQVVVPAGSTLLGAAAAGSSQAIQTIGQCSSVGGCASQYFNPDTGMAVPLAEGETLAIVRLSLGSFAPDLPAACTDLSLDLGDATAAPIDVTRNVGVTPIFSFGADALDNPGTDPAIVGSAANVPVTPRLLIVRKSIDAPEGETATGPNYPRPVRIEMGVANGATVTDANLVDILPPTLQFVAGSLGFAGCTGTVTDTGTPSGATPGGTVGRQCSTVTGNGTSAQLVLQFDVFVPLEDASAVPVITPASPTRVITNDASATATYDPPGAPPPGPVTGSGSANLTAKLAPVRKSVTLSSDPSGNGASHLDTLTYRIEYDLSDFFRVDLTAGAGLTFVDTLGDGQTFLGCADAGTTLSAFANGVTVAAAPFPGGTCTSSAKDPTTGETTITFNVGTALGGSYGTLLNGDLAGDTTLTGPTRIVVEFRAVIDVSYSASPFPGPGSPFLSVGDVVGNAVSANSSSLGSPATDGSSASTTIGSEVFAKTIYAYNGAPPTPNFLVAAGDTVTFRVRWDVSTATFEQASITDFLPAPLFRVTGFNVAGDGAIAGTGTAPAAGRWTTGPADTFTTLGASPGHVAPTVTTSAPNNAITWDYGTRNLGLPNQVVDLLITVQATDEPFGDGLAFTNVANLLFGNSVGATSSDSGTGAVVTRAPDVTIRKAIEASSDPSCAAATPPANFDDARAGCDASDTVTYRVALENAGRAPAYGVRVDDDGGLPAPGYAGSCTVLTVQDGNGATVATTGNLFDTTPNGGLSVASIPGDASSTVSSDERVVVRYQCTIAAGALASLPDRRIDNTARLKYYTNVPGEVTDPAFNFAGNQNFPGPNVRRARADLATVTAISKAITNSSVIPTVTPNVNSGETLTFKLSVTLAEGTYANYAFTDTLVAVPAINCADAAFTCTGNVSVVGPDLTVAPTAGSTTGTVTYAYTQAQTASGTNTASFSATNVPASTATSTWTLGNPAPGVTKSFQPAAADASDTVQVRLGWQNANAANPMYRCVVTDPLDIVTFDPATISPVTTPAGYTVGVDSGTGVVTYTATDTTNPCPDVAAGGAVFSVGLRSTAVAGGSITNTASLAGNTLPTPQPGGAAVTASGSAALALGSPAINTKVIQSTTEPDANTAGGNVAVGERVTYRVTFTMPDGLTHAVRLVDDMRGGLANLTYVAGSAMLARNTAALAAGNDPGGINAAAPGAFVPVVPQCIGVAPCESTQLRFDLGEVTNDPATGGATDNYTLEIAFQVANVSANTLNATRDNRGQVVYQPDGTATDQTVNGGVARVTIVSPVVSITKNVLVARLPGGPLATYTLTIANTATGPGAGPAFDWTFSDVLPPSLTAPVLDPLPPGVTASFAGNTLTGTIARLDPGAQVVVTYDATVDPLTPSGATIVNAASAAATSLPGANGTGDATPGVPGAADGERTGAGGTNNLSGASSAAFTLGNLGIRKLRLTTAPAYAIGDEVQYEIAITVPLGTTQDVSATDLLPAGLAFVAGSASVSTIGGPVSTSLPGVPPTLASPNARFDFGTVTATAPAIIVVTYRAVVRNVLSNQRGSTLTNGASLMYFDDDAGADVTVPAANPPAIIVGEPNLEVLKTIEAGSVGSDAGDPVDFRLVVENTGDVAAHRVDVRDVLPAGLFQISNVAVATAGQVVIEGTATAVTVAHAHVLTTTNTGDTLDIATLAPDGSDTIALAPGARLQVDFRAVLMNTVTPGQVIANAVRVAYASQPDCPTHPECRDGSSGLLADDDVDALLNNYAETDVVALTVAADVALTKTVSSPRAVVGGTVVYTHRVHLIEGTTPAVIFTDVLPPGLSYVSHAITVGNLGMTIGNPAYATRLGSGQTVTLDLGDVTNPTDGSAADDYVQIEIEVRVDNVASNVDGTVLSNGDEASGSTVSVTFGAGPTTVSFDADPVAAGLQGRPITVIEPDLAIAKVAMPSSVSLGDVVTFALDISHTAASHADAFDLVATDTLPAGLTFVPGSVNPPGAFVSSAGPVVTLGTGSLSQAAGSTHVTYRATVEPSATIGVPLANAVRLEWSSVPGATGSATSGRTGTGGVDDYFATAAAEVTPNANAFIDATKTVAIVIDQDTSGSLTPGDTLEYTVVLTNNDGPASNVVFTDPTPIHTTYVGGSATTTAGSVTGTDPLVVAVGPMASGATVTIRFRVTVDAGTAGGTLIRNQGIVESDQTVPEPTDVDGNDPNGDQPTDIIVASNLPGAALLRAPKSVALLTDVDGSGSTTQGDRMRYTFALQNLGTVPLTDVFLTDTIPAGLTYVPGSAAASAGSIGVVGQTVTWGPVPNVPVGTTSTATVDVTITSVTPPSQAYINQGTASSPQSGAVLTDGNASILDGAQPTVFYAVASGLPATPVLDVQKRWFLGADLPPTGTPSPGDSLIYTITVTNVGSGPATNVRLADPAPTCTGVLDPCTSYVAGSLVTSQGAVVGTNPVEVNLGTLAIGASATVSFRVLVDVGTQDGVIVANQAAVTRDGTASAVPSDDNGSPVDGLNPTLTPISIAPRAEPRSVAKVLVGTSEPDTISLGNAVVVGEVLRYRVTFDAAPGTTPLVAFRDVLPPGLAYVAGSAKLSRAFDTALSASANPGGINGAASGAFVALADGTEFVASTSPGGISTLTAGLGTVINSDADANAETYVLEYRALVTNTATVQAGATLSNAATVTWLDGLLQPHALPAAVVPVIVHEPAVVVTMQASPSTVPVVGGIVTYTIVVANETGPTAAPAFDVNVLDLLPPTFESMTIGSIVAIGAQGVVDGSSGTTVRLDIARLDPGGSVTVVVQATTAKPPAAGTNTVRATWTSLPGDSGSAFDGAATPGPSGAANGERNGLLGAVNDYVTSAALPLRIGSPVTVPTLSSLGIALLALWLAVAATVRLRAGGRARRRDRANPRAM